MAAAQSNPAAAPRRFEISCEEAHRYAARALRVNNFEVTGVERSANSGVVTGLREDTTVEMHLACDGSGATVHPSGGGSWLENGMKTAFERIAEGGDRIWPPPKSPRVFTELVRGPESKLFFSGLLDSSGMVGVRVRVVNGGSWEVRVVPRRIRAVAGSSRVAPISASTLTPEHRSRALVAKTLSGGDSVVGFVFFPAGSYSGVSVPLVDVESGEADEYEVSFE